ncbi:MAG: hypothetical protein K8S16_21465 [Bacteroidales bacterium]|nr:hypothetical protein [Bacteroidales bacterium]
MKKFYASVKSEKRITLKGIASEIVELSSLSHGDVWSVLKEGGKTDT